MRIRIKDEIFEAIYLNKISEKTLRMRFDSVIMGMDVEYSDSVLADKFLENVFKNGYSDVAISKIDTEYPKIRIF